jgi:C2 domain
MPMGSLLSRIFGKSKAKVEQDKNEGEDKDVIEFNEYEDDV